VGVGDDDGSRLRFVDRGDSDSDSTRRLIVRVGDVHDALVLSVLRARRPIASAPSAEGTGAGGGATTVGFFALRLSGRYCMQSSMTARLNRPASKQGRKYSLS